MSRKPVEEGRGHAIIGKDGIPIATSQIGSNDDGNLFIEIANQQPSRLAAPLVFNTCIRVMRNLSLHDGMVDGYYERSVALPHQRRQEQQETGKKWFILLLTFFTKSVEAGKVFCLTIVCGQRKLRRYVTIFWLIF